ncbi:MAG: type II secretion system minor pseudopilin GspK [Usitatibacteraceae bacterium]
MSRPHRQRGTAIITALLVVLIAASVAAFLLAQQNRALTRTARATERAQAMLFTQPMLQWARSALFEFQKSSSSVDLTQAWAQPIGAQPIEGAIATGFFRDECGRFNVNNLIGADGKISQIDVEVFRRLLENLSLNPDLVYALADWIDSDDEARFPGGAESASYMSLPQPYRAANKPLVQIEELDRVKGFDAATINKLKPFITALPTRTRININTAPAEVVAAALPTLATKKPVLDELVSRRMTQPFKTLDGEKGVKAFLKDVPAADVDALLLTNSDYFSVALGISTGGTQLRQSALFQRAGLNAANAKPTAWPRIIWVKDD